MRSVDLKTPRRLQESCDFCGPAVVEMALTKHSIDNIPQAHLLQEIRRADGGGDFVSSPRALATVLSNISGVQYSVFSEGSADELLVRIVACIAAGFPVPALAYSCGHWLLVRGYWYGGAHSQIGAVLINDPFNQCLDCDQDGRISPLCRRGRFRGTVEESISLQDWRSRVMTGCKLEFVCVAPAHIQREDRFDLSVPSRVTVDTAEIARTYVADAGGLRTVELLLKRAVEAFGMMEIGDVASALEGARAANLLRVKYIDIRGSYLIVEMRRAGVVTALIRFNGETGDFLGMRSITGGDPKFLPSSEDLPGLIVETGGKRKWLEIIPEITPIWGAINEFRSPYFPFLLAEGVGAFGLVNGIEYSGVNKALA